MQQGLGDWLSFVARMLAARERLLADGFSTVSPQELFAGSTFARFADAAIAAGFERPSPLLLEQLRELLPMDDPASRWRHIEACYKCHRGTEPPLITPKHPAVRRTLDLFMEINGGVPAALPLNDSEKSIMRSVALAAGFPFAFDGLCEYIVALSCSRALPAP